MLEDATLRVAPDCILANCSLPVAKVMCTELVSKLLGTWTDTGLCHDIQAWKEIYQTVTI